MTTALDELITRYEETTASSAPTSRFELAELRRSLESAEARAAQLETDNDEMQSYINEIRVALHTEKDELTIEAVRRVISERDTAWSELREIRKAINADENEATSDEVRRVVAELARKLEQAQQTLRSIEDQAGRAALVQDRSVSIIKQTCKIIADKAKAAMAA